MAITRTWLKSAANPKSFSKGEDCYDDVDDLIKNGNKYSATVYGTDEYDVLITDSAFDEPTTYCSCPYDYDGICKHIVAVGLNIIDGNFEEEDIKVFENNQSSDITALKLPTTTFYEDFFKPKSKKIRKAFLQQLFANDESLRRQFYEFSKPKEETTPSVKESNLIEKTAKSLMKKLEKITALEPEDFYSRGRYNDYHYDEGDGYRDWIEEKIESIFNPFEKEALLFIQNGEVQAATEFLIGLYEGCLGLEFENETEDYMGDGFESVALAHLDSLIIRLNEALKKVIFHENDIKTSILLILNRQANREDAFVFISFFESYLMALSIRPDIAKWLIKESSERHLTLDLIHLTLANAETIDDDTLWIDSAEKLAHGKEDIMQLLLDKYLSLNRLTEFHKAANTAFTFFERGSFVPYLKSKVLKEYDTDLYIKVHLKSAKMKSELKDFLKVRSLLTPEMESEFIRSSKKDNQNLYVDILNDDGDLAGILSFVKEQNSQSHSYYYHSYGLDMSKALTYIIKQYPDEVFKIVQRQALLAFDNMKMDRQGYAQACAYLKPLKKLPDSHKPNFNTLLQTLRERFKTRPAFLDELSKI